MKKMRKSTFNFCWLLTASVSRLIPHLANFSPFPALCVLLSLQNSLKASTLWLLATLMISDVCYGLIYHFPIFGGWTFFTYTGFLGLFFAKPFLKKLTFKRITIVMLLSGLGFWLWTNFGVWITSEMYPHTAQGFIMCYIAALPFLKTALLGNVFWGIIILKGIPKFVPLSVHCVHSDYGPPLNKDKPV